jgi:uncharacterized protein YbgA (DUF1722 family)
MTVVKIATEMLWAKNKYEIMAKGYDKYSKIKTMFKEANSNDDYYQIYREIKIFKDLPYTKKAMKNTLEHIWGYFKRDASKEEKQLFFLLLDELEQLPMDSYVVVPLEVEKILSFAVELVETYNQLYLQNSTILFPQLVWNEVHRKKEVFFIDDKFYC